MLINMDTVSYHSPYYYYNVMDNTNRNRRYKKIFLKIKENGKHERVITSN